MKTKNTILSKIKELFESVEKFADVKTTDGTILRISNGLNVGSTVQIIAEDGTTTPATAGDYTLTDGSTITVDETGSITEVTLADADESDEMAATPAAPAEAAPAETPAEQTNEDNTDSDVETRLANLEAAVEMIGTQVQSLMGNDANTEAMSELKKEISSLKKENKKLASAPATPTPNFKKVEPIKEDVFSKIKTTTKPNSDVEKFMSVLGELKETIGTEKIKESEKKYLTVFAKENN